jgi:hypothetical protein
MKYFVYKIFWPGNYVNYACISKKTAFAVLVSTMIAVTIIAYKDEGSIQNLVIAADQLSDDLTHLQIIRERINLTSLLIKLYSSNQWTGSDNGSHIKYLPNHQSFQGPLVELEYAIEFSADALLFNGALLEESPTGQRDVYLFGSIKYRSSHPYQQKLFTLQGLLEEYSLIVQSLHNQAKADPNRPHFQSQELAAFQSLNEIREEIFTLIDNIFYQVQKEQIFTASSLFKKQKILFFWSAIMLILMIMMLFLFDLFNKNFALFKSEKQVKKKDLKFKTNLKRI